MTSYWEANPYIAHSLPLWPQRTDLGVDLSLDYQISPDLSAFLRIKYVDNLNHYYWARDSGSGLFSLQNTGAIEVSEFQAGVEWGQHDWLELRLQAELYSVRYPAGSGISNLNYIPYRAKVQVPVTATIALPLDFNLSAEGRYMGRRQIELTSDRALPAFYLVNGSISRQIGRNITVSLAARNVLNETYVYWEQYPETGIQIFLELQAKL